MFGADGGSRRGSPEGPRKRANDGRCHGGTATVSGSDVIEVMADQMAVTDVLIRFFALVDAKGWDRMHEVFTDDTTVRRGPDSIVEGRAAVVAGMREMVDNDEIVTYHHAAIMVPAIDGDTAEVTARVRAMHHGVGPRTGKFYESLAVQPTRLIRTTEGWRIQHRDWLIQVKLGSLEDLFAPELAARRREQVQRP
jgi:SnoaL-like domain